MIKKKSKDCKTCMRYVGDCGYHFKDSLGHIDWEIPSYEALDRWNDCSFYEVAKDIHVLKIRPEYFEEVETGRKRFELRKDDRNFKKGDKVFLKEWDGVEFTGRVIEKKIRYILRDCPEYGLDKEYCILGF